MTGRKSRRATSFWETLLGTTLSIVLTFGTAALIDHHHKVKTRRQMAMMVIHDIDNALVEMERVDSLLKGFSDTQREFARQQGRMSVFAFSPYYSLEYKIPETYRRIFSSSIDTWLTLGNAGFIDNVGECYLRCQDFEEQVVGEVRRELLNVGSITDPDALGRLMAIDADSYSLMTQVAIRGIRRINEENKRLMKISETDLKEFSRSRRTLADEPDAYLDSLLEEYAEKAAARQAWPQQDAR